MALLRMMAICFFSVMMNNVFAGEELKVSFPENEDIPSLFHGKSVDTLFCRSFTMTDEKFDTICLYLRYFTHAYAPEKSRFDFYIGYLRSPYYQDENWGNDCFLNAYLVQYDGMILLEGIENFKPIFAEDIFDKISLRSELGKGGTVRGMPENYGLVMDMLKEKGAHLTFYNSYPVNDVNGNVIPEKIEELKSECCFP